MQKFVLWGKYCPDVEQKRLPYRQAHLENLRHLQEQGQLLTIGPTSDLSRVFGIYLAPDLTTAKQMIESDPYWQNQIWVEYELLEWIQAI
ncbi:MAG: YciI family protein [Pseudanabaenaceae cyanobacterium bins.68]|nr:YciI family protein [Pseudanabaenaceae cyanobacterium bins.68]